MYQKKFWDDNELYLDILEYGYDHGKLWEKGTTELSIGCYGGVLSIGTVIERQGV